MTAETTAGTGVASPQRTNAAPAVPTPRTRSRMHPRTVASQVLLTIVLLIFLMPFVWMIATALKPPAEVFGAGNGLVGSEIRWSNFAEAWGYLPFGRFMLNGLYVALAGTVVVCVTSVLSAYAFARLRFRFRDRIFLLYLGTLMVPQEVTVVPMFILMQQFGWVDSYAALILPWAFTAFGTFLLRQFFLSIPEELSDAARLDGASEFQIYRQIILPLSKPALASLAILAFVWSWNDYETPLVMLTTESKFTIPLGLTRYMDEAGGFSPSLIMAGAVSSIVPVLVVFLLLQRHFIAALARSGMKG